MRRFLAALILLGLCALPALAQQRFFQPPQPSRWTLRIDGGVNPTLGDTRGHLDFGGNLGVSAGYNLTRQLSLLGEFSFYGFGLDQHVIQENNVPGGQAHMWVFTVDPVWRFRPRGNSAYFIGGVGYYDRVVEFTQPTLAPTIIYDPWFGYIGSVLVPANVVIGSFSSHAFGGNAGFGYEWQLGHHRFAAPAPHVFVEARVHYANTRGRKTQMIPITVGVRW